MRRSEDLDAGEDGFTLVELLVTCGLMSLCAVLVMTTIIGGLRTSARGEKRTDDAARAQRTMLQLTADLRAASGVDEATPSKVVLFTRSRGAATSTPVDAPEKVTYERTALGQLVMTRQAGTVAIATGAWTAVGTASASTVLDGVLDPTQAGRALFTYLSADDSERQCSVGATASSLGATVSGLSGLNAIYSVDVWLSVQSRPQLGGRPLVVPGGAVLVNKGVLTLDPANLSTLGIGTGCS